ncbi:MAG: peptide-methionine (S)-S-oxide reductase MsrA, partial [Candidatus Aminicenantes bacterium]|nr:peptide-methionine (S)-S-oxide reductase MsrA [Candidatus Aminicenantes bacterium]
GRRTEIVCANCDAHLGHVFFGEKYTAKDTRHCVNSVSMNFVPAKTEKRTETAVFASGCFWGSEYHFERKKGVISTRAGYTGGTSENVSYEEVCSGTTGHAEAVEVVFDPSVISYEELAKLYFNTHDPSQLNRQGPDIGTQYRSEIFYESEDQKKTAEKLIKLLKDKGINVVTALSRSGKFWEAEKYHQNYYRNKGGTPYCHIYQDKF